jgi:hypothetical protein
MIVITSMILIPALAGMLFLVKLFAPGHPIFRRPERRFRPGILHLMILVAIVACDFWLSFPEAGTRSQPRGVLMFGCDLVFFMVVPAVGSLRPRSLFGWLGIAMLLGVAIVAIGFALTFVVPAH